jgi:peptidoglycan/LPS O-acetylase OafA/YrhL
VGKKRNDPAAAGFSDSAEPGSTRVTPTGTGKDLPNLDAIRSAAVITVLVGHTYGATHLFHYGSFYGTFGVGLFFVHTALVLMWSLQRKPNAIEFYIRRIARIYPLSIVVLLIAVATRAKVNAYYDSGSFFIYNAPTIKQVLTHLLLIQNIFSGNFIVYPMWSLPIEVQMYILLPPLFFFLRRRMSLWPLLIAWAFAVLAVYHFGASHANILFAIPYFLSGLIAYVGFSTRISKFPGWSFLIFFAVLLVLGGHAGGWVAASWPCLALALLLPSFKQLPAGVMTKACWYVARYSYGIYLLHPFSLLLGFYVCRFLPPAIQYTVAFASLTVFSVAAYHLIEEPCIRSGTRLAKSVATHFGRE